MAISTSCMPDFLRTAARRSLLQWRSSWYSWAEFCGKNRWAQVLLALCGFLVTWFGTLWLGLGLQEKLLRHYGRFLLPGESLVVVQATEADTPVVIEVLRRISHPSVFAIRPGLRLGSSRQPDEALREPVTLASLPDCAIELAASHQLDISTRSRSLLPILRECEVAIESARADLGEAARLDYGIHTPPSGCWTIPT